MSHEEKKSIKNVLNNLSPKQAAIGGLLVAVLVICTIGFFILLSVRYSGADVAGAFGLTRGGRAGGSPSALTTTSGGGVPAVTAKDHIRGDKNAPITLIEYSDYECPYCKSFHPTMQQLLGDMNGRVRWVFRHFPLSFHENAPKQAEASECVAELGGNDAFWSFTDKVFERTTSGGTGLALTELPTIASEVGVDRQKFEDCLNSNKYAAKVQAEMAAGAAAGVNATPSLIVMNKQGKSQLIAGAVPVATIIAAIDSLSQ